jgi:hypothetical protein
MYAFRTLCVGIIRRTKCIKESNRGVEYLTEQFGHEEDY